MAQGSASNLRSSFNHIFWHLCLPLEDALIYTDWKIFWDTSSITSSQHFPSSSFTVPQCLCLKNTWVRRHFSHSFLSPGVVFHFLLFSFHYPSTTPHFQQHCICYYAPQSEGLCSMPACIFQTINHVTEHVSLTGMFIVLLTGQC